MLGLHACGTHLVYVVLRLKLEETEHTRQTLRQWSHIARPPVSFTPIIYVLTGFTFMAKISPKGQVPDTIILGDLDYSVDVLGD